MLKYATNLFESRVLPIQKHAKVYLPKSIGFIVVGPVKTRADKITAPEGIIFVASR